MIALTWLACGSPAPTRAEAPDPEASRALADALCKVAQTAKHDCKLDGSTPVIDSTLRVTVDTYLDTVEERFGITTFEGRVAISAPGRPTVTTHFRHFGMGRAEALGNGTHLWAVVDAAPVVDWLLKDGTRPALRGLYKEEAAPAPMLKQGSFAVLPGWTFREGVAKHPDLGALAKAMAPHVGADGVHMVDLRIQPANGRLERTCHLDGEPADALCSALPGSAFPDGIGWGMKQAWLWVPASDLPDAPVPPPTE